MWQPDGWGWRARIGVLTRTQTSCQSPNSELWPRMEFRSTQRASLLESIIREGRWIRQSPTIQCALLPTRRSVDDAAELLAAAPLHAIVYGFTSSSYVRGPADDVALKERLELRTRGIPVVIPCAAAVVALTALGVTRLALINPPWFSAELSQQGANYFHDQGLDVVHHGPAGLPSDQLAIEPGQLYEWVCAHTPASAEAVFIGGNGFRSIGAIQVLEKDLSRPVLTANQVAFWLALRFSCVCFPIAGYGRIFDRELSPAQTR